MNPNADIKRILKVTVLHPTIMLGASVNGKGGKIRVNPGEVLWIQDHNYKNTGKLLIGWHSRAGTTIGGFLYSRELFERTFIPYAAWLIGQDQTKGTDGDGFERIVKQAALDMFYPV